MQTAGDHRDELLPGKLPRACGARFVQGPDVIAIGELHADASESIEAAALLGEPRSMVDCADALHAVHQSPSL